MRPYVVGLLGLLTILGAVWLAFGERDRDLARLVTDLTRGPAPAQAPPAASTVAPAAPAAPPAPAPTQAAPPPPPRPSFDIVRVNARGDAVMAGRAAPHADIVILDGPREIGQVKADDRGEWVFVPSAPMPPGGRELLLRARNPDGSVWESASAVVLVVPERDRDVAGRPVAPGAAPPPIALLTPREPGGALQVLQAPRADEPPAPAPPAEPPAAARQATAPASSPSPPAPVAAPVPAAPLTPPLAAAPAQPAPEVMPPTPAPPVAASSPLAAAPPAPEPVAPAPVFSAPAPPDPAPPAPATPAPTPPVAMPPPDPSPAPPAVPAPPAPAVVAAAPPVEPSRPVAAPAIPQGRPPGGVSVDAVDYGPAGDVSFAGRANPGESVRLYLDGQHLGDTRADAEGRWNLAPEAPIEPGRTQALRADQVAPDGRVTARVQVPFQRAETPPEGLREGSVIVQPGHSLWRIARETYGRGIRYTVIYEANREQIRNPDLIYPGQIFVLPGAERGG
jgi:nucleoid-associated protein YgaU